MSEIRKLSILLSSCLLGHPVRYDGKGGRLDEKILDALKQKFNVVHICPEVAGGLDTPRAPAEIVGGSGDAVHENIAKVMTREGRDVSSQFLEGANQTLWLCKRENVRAAVLKERSPSCGSNMIYNGEFSGVTEPGFGVTAALLIKNGIRVFSEENVEALLSSVDDISWTE